MSDSIVDLAWNNFLRAEYEEEQIRRAAPGALPAATKKRVAAARALAALGVDISLMRRVRIDVAVAGLGQKLAQCGVRATVKRKGTRIIVESPEKIGSDPLPGPVLKWADASGVKWTSSTWPHMDGEPVSVLSFRLVAPGQPEWAPGVVEALRSRPAASPPVPSASACTSLVEAGPLIVEWWAAEDVVGRVAVDDAAQSLTLETNDEIDMCGGAAARFESWLAAHGLRSTGHGHDGGSLTTIRVGPAPAQAEPVEARHLGRKIEDATLAVGRATIEHVLRRPKYERTSSERMREAIARFVARRTTQEQ